jgi:hypothetical protein
MDTIKSDKKRLRWSFFFSVTIHFAIYILLFHLMIKYFKIEIGQLDIDNLELTGEGDSKEIDPDKLAELKSNPKWKGLIEQLEKAEAIEKSSVSLQDPNPVQTDVPKNYIQRKREFQDIIVKEVLPTLKDLDVPFLKELEESEESLNYHKERNDIIRQYRGEEPISSKIQFTIDGVLERVPLSMPREERLAYLDKTIKDSKEKQLQDFIDRFSGYDPNEGDLPIFWRELYEDNLLRITYSFSRDPTFFAIDFFQENLNKEDFLKQALYIVKKDKNTKVSTELLLAIESIYSIQQKALNLLLENKDLESLELEGGKEIRRETIRALWDKYKPVLDSKGIKDKNTSEEYFRTKRKEILELALSSTPNKYREPEILFRLGKFYWDSNTKDETDSRKALEIWNRVYSQKYENIDPKLKVVLESIRSATSNFQEIPKPKEAIRIIVESMDADLVMKKSARDRALLWGND